MTDYWHREQTTTAEHYTTFAKNVKKALKEKKQREVEAQFCSIVHRDSAPPDKSAVVMGAINEVGFKV